jgi:hypothetical protein
MNGKELYERHNLLLRVDGGAFGNLEPWVMDAWDALAEEAYKRVGTQEERMTPVMNAIRKAGQVVLPICTTDEKEKVTRVLRMVRENVQAAIG